MNNIRQFLALFAALLAVPVLSRGASPAAKGDYLVFVGTYTRGESKGIYAYRFQAGKLSPLGLAAETPNPSFVALHPNHRFLYSVSEMANPGGEKGGAVSAFAIDPKTGKLTFLNKVSSRGSGPCYVSVDKTGKNVLIANYGSGSVAVLRIGEDGHLGEVSAFVQHTGSSVNPRRQQGPHAHMITPSPDNRFAVAADLGLDKVFVYRFDPAKGSLSPNDPPFAKVHPGAGPRHFAFHPNGRLAYVINEIQSTVTAFTYDAARGVLTEIQTISTQPKDFTGNNTTAEIEVHPSGKFLYGSNRGHNSIAVFAIAPGKGTLTPIEHVSTQGRTPRNFGIDPTGSYLLAANQDKNDIVVFRIDQKTGRLTPTGQTVSVGAPVCVTFLPVN